MSLPCRLPSLTAPHLSLLLSLLKGLDLACRSVTSIKSVARVMASMQYTMYTLAVDPIRPDVLARLPAFLLHPFPTVREVPSGTPLFAVQADRHFHPPRPCRSGRLPQSPSIRACKTISTWTRRWKTFFSRLAGLRRMHNCCGRQSTSLLRCCQAQRSAFLVTLHTPVCPTGNTSRH